MSLRFPKWALLVLAGIWIVLPGRASAQRPNFSVSAPVTVDAGDNAGVQAVAVGDVNKDGHPDIVSVSSDAEGGPLAVLINNGDGTFSVPHFVADEGGSLTEPVAVAIADVGSPTGGLDENPDIIVIDLDEGFLVAFGDGAGNFTIDGDVTVVDGVDAPLGIAVGDFDGQNGPDLAIIDDDGTDDNGQVYFFCNEGTAGIFNPCNTFVLDSGGATPIDVGIGDFNGDGQKDVMVLNQGINTGEGTVGLFLGHGDGTFTLPAQATFSLPRVPQDLAIGNMNPGEDSIDDAAVADDDLLGEDNVSLFFGGTSGSLLTRRSAVLELATTALTIGSFGGSSNPDLAGTNDGDAADTSNEIAVTTGNGTNDQNPFNNSSQVAAQLPGAGRAIATGRFDTDTMDDVVVLSLDASSLRIGINRAGSATETPGTPAGGSPTPTPTPTRAVATPELKGCSVTLPVASGALSLAIVKGDFDGDSDTDLAVLDRDGRRLYLLLINPADLTQGSTPSQPICTIDVKLPVDLGGQYASLAAGHLNGDKTDDLAVAGSSGVRVLIGLGGGQFDQHQVPTETAYQSVAIGDFDSGQGGDVAALSGANVVIFRGSTFIQVQSLTIAGATLLASGDFDGESGEPDDLVVATSNPNAAFILLHDGTGGENPFAPPTNTSTSRALLDGVPRAMAVVKNEASSQADAVVVSTESLDQGFVALVRRIVSGSSVSIVASPSPARKSGAAPTAVGAGDVVGSDNIADAVVSSNNDNGVVSFVPGNSDGSFGTALPPTSVGENPDVSYQPSGVVVGDLDGDGHDDVAVVNTGTGSLFLLLSSLVPATPTPTVTNTSGPATITPTRGPTGTPTMTPRSTPKATATFKEGTFELSGSSCSIGSGRSGGRSNGAVVLLGGVALIVMRLRRPRSK